MDIKRAHETSKGIVEGTVDEFVRWAIEQKLFNRSQLWKSEFDRNFLKRRFLEDQGIHDKQ